MYTRKIWKWRWYNLGEESSLEVRIKRAEDDIVELKTINKDLSKDFTTIKESHIETKIYMTQIRDSQAQMAKDSKENQLNMLSGLQEVKDAPRNSFKQLSMAVKVTAISVLVTYIIGSIAGFIKMFAK